MVNRPDDEGWPLRRNHNFLKNQASGVDLKLCDKRRLASHSLYLSTDEDPPIAGEVARQEDVGVNTFRLIVRIVNQIDVGMAVGPEESAKYITWIQLVAFVEQGLLTNVILCHIAVEDDTEKAIWRLFKVVLFHFCCLPLFNLESVSFFAIDTCTLVLHIRRLGHLVLTRWVILLETRPPSYHSKMASNELGRDSCNRNLRFCRCNRRFIAMVNLQNNLSIP